MTRSRRAAPAIGNGRLVGFVDNRRRHAHLALEVTRADRQLPGREQHGQLRADRALRAQSGVIYYEAQSSAIPAAQKATNAAVMHQQEDITLFQTQFNGPFPFSTNGVIVGIPTAGFEEEMQTKITFQRSRISLGVFHHENQHQWWGDNVSEGAYNLTFFKEGYADMSEGFATARTAATNAGGLGTPAGDAAFETSLRTRFNGTYGSTGSFWTVAPSNPQSNNLFGGSNTYSRPGRLLPGAAGDPRQGPLQLRLQGDPGHLRRRVDHRGAGDRGLPQVAGEPERRVLGPAGRVLQAVVGHGLSVGRRRQQAVDHRPRPERDQLLQLGRRLHQRPSAGTVPATLSLTLGAPASFGAFAPGVDRDYTASTTRERDLHAPVTRR